MQKLATMQKQLIEKVLDESLGTARMPAQEDGGSKAA
jgi:hypothetical protein